MSAVDQSGEDLKLSLDLVQTLEITAPRLVAEKIRAVIDRLIASRPKPDEPDDPDKLN
jgi:hypothetical protein